MLYADSFKGGTAMGQRHSVVLANVFMSHFFRKFFAANQEWKRRLPFFKRFLDDIFGFWNGPLSCLYCFVADLNSWSATNGWQIQFKLDTVGDTGNKMASFLDVNVYLNNLRQWHTTLFSK